MACPFDVILSTKSTTSVDDCSKKIKVAHDILDVLSGKWKMEVIMALLNVEKRRFKELQQDITGVSAKVLSAVLKDLEEHHILVRTLVFSAPFASEYRLTEYGKSMKQTIEDLVRLGIRHRSIVMGEDSSF